MEDLAARILKEYSHTLDLVKTVGPVFAAFVAAIIAAYIAWRQWRTSRDKLRFEVYQERITYLKRLREFKKEFVDKMDALDDRRTFDLDRFQEDMAGAEFLFSKKIVDDVSHIVEQTNTLQHCCDRIVKIRAGLAPHDTDKVPEFLERREKLHYQVLSAIDRIENALKMNLRLDNM